MATPSDDHLLAFGRIMFNFAAVESGIKITLSGILDIRLGEAMIAFQPYGATDLKNVAKSLSKERLKPELSAAFCNIVGQWSGHSALRNTIAHNRWTDGERPGAIKPRYLSIREGRADWYGDEPDETDYLAAELEAKALDLHKINERLKRFMRDSGIQRLVEAKMATTRA